MNITDPMSRTCLAMVAGLVLVSVSVGDDRGQGRGDQPLRFAGPLAVHPRNPRYFVGPAVLYLTVDKEGSSDNKGS